MFRKASLGLFLAAVAALSLFLANAFPANSHRAEAASAPVQHGAVVASPDGNCVQVSNTLGGTNSVCAGFSCGFFASSCIGGCGFINSCFGGCGTFINSCLGGGCSTVANVCVGGCNLNAVFCSNNCFGFNCGASLCGFGFNSNCFGSICGLGTACLANCGFSALCPNLGFLPAPVAPAPAAAITFSAFPNAGTCGSFLDLNLTATVSGGQPVADGTTIGLVTTLGSVTKTVTTDGGAAVARLVIDPHVRGTATITATAPNGATGTKTINITCAV